MQGKGKGTWNRKGSREGKRDREYEREVGKIRECMGREKGYGQDGEQGQEVGVIGNRKMESDRQKEEEGKVVNKRGREKSSKRQRRGEMGQENGEGQAKR